MANDAFAKVYKAVVDSQLVWFFIDGLYHDFLCMKVMTENPKIFQAEVESTWAEQNLQKRFQLRSNDHEDPKGRTKEPMEIDHIRLHKNWQIICQDGRHTHLFISLTYN